MDIKWKEIKKLTSIGKYEVDLSLGDLKSWLRRQKSLNLDLNPNFQRGHVWKRVQKVKFIEFLLKGGRTTPLYFNHPGWMGDFKGEFVIVDGLQRLTAILEFIRGELEVFGGYTINEFKDKAILKRAIDIKININNLKTKKEVLNWYIEMNEYSTPHTEEELLKAKKILSTL